MGDGNGNGRKVTVRELDGKLDLLREQQRSEHLKTRALVLVVGMPSVLKSAALLAGLNVPHVPFI